MYVCVTCEAHRVRSSAVSNEPHERVRSSKPAPSRTAERRNPTPDFDRCREGEGWLRVCRTLRSSGYNAVPRPARVIAFARTPSIISMINDILVSVKFHDCSCDIAIPHCRPSPQRKIKHRWPCGCCSPKSANGRKRHVSRKCRES